MRCPLRIVMVLATVALVAGCTFGAGQSPFRPSFRQEACPKALEPLLIPRHSCGNLTVLEDRSRPQGRTIQLFVVRIEPQAGRPANRGPMFVPGTNLATSSGFYDLVGAAERLHREIIIMEQRGVGMSRPSLDCPEIDAVTTQGLREGIGAPDARAAFLGSVSACWDRLRRQGIDPAAYDLPAMAADAEDLRRALGIDAWGVSTYGSASLVALQMLRDDRAHITELVLDSPQFPNVDPIATDIAGTKEGIDRILRACTNDSECSKVYPNLALALRRATRTLDAHPVTVRTRTLTGTRVVLRVDGSALLRALRILLSLHGQVSKAEEPAAISSVARRDLGATVAPILASAPPFCAGYLPQCDEIHPVSEGTYLSVLCRDVAPWVHPRSAARLAGGDPAYRQAFVQNPWIEACARWKVPPGDSSVSQPVSSDVPTLILIGRYDPFAPTAIVERAAGSLTEHWIAMYPSGGHNVLDKPCMIQIRNTWWSHPALPPDLRCLRTIPQTPFDLGRP
jgi:pimeloyl-ACP methyl ester carboxylesterase